jgi:type II secretion system protein N
MNYLIRFLRAVFKQGWKILGVTTLTVLFLLLIFPFQDLNDFISNKVLEFTNNQVFLQFDDMGINPLMGSISLEKVKVDSNVVENLTVDELTATPHLMGLLQRHPAARVVASGIFGGSLDIDVSPGTQAKSEVSVTEIKVASESLSIKEALRAFNIGLPLDGALTLQLRADVEGLVPTEEGKPPAGMSKLPNGELQATVQKFEFSSSPINVPGWGPLIMPELKIQKIDAKARLQDGKLSLESVQIGSEKDDLSGTISGELNVSIPVRDDRPGVPQQPLIINNYDLSFDLLAKPDFVGRAQVFLNLIDQYKQNDARGTRYRFRMAASSPGAPPQFSPLR